MYKDILIYVEIDKPYSWEKALPQAAEYCEKFDARLHVLTAVPDYGMAIVQQYFPEGYEDQVTAKALEQLKAWLADQLPGDIDSKPYVAEGKARDAVLRIAKAIECDLIVISQSRQKSKYYALGATAAHVVRHAPCSVLIVR